MKYTFEISIEASNEKDAVSLLQSASELMKRLKPHELKKLSEVVKNDPVKTNFAKKALGL